MTRSLPLFLLALVGCGPKAELIRYTIEIAVQDVPPWLNAESAGVYYEVAPCNNAEVFDQTILVYEGSADEAVAAIQLHWTGFDLSNGGDNVETHFLAKGELLDVHAALKPDTVLYQVDHKGRMLEVDRDTAKVKGRDKAEAEYILGEGLAIAELHEVQKEVDLVDFIEPGVPSCDHTEF